jgi:subtilisin family serine protease
MHAWIERDETLPGFSEFGRQSYFDDPLYARFYEPGVDANALDSRLIGGRLGYDPLNGAALVQRAGTLNGFAGGKGPIVIGGFVKAPLPQNSPMALYSSTGLKRDGVDTFPDASARSDDSGVRQGVLSAGSASGSFVPMNGTSVSAPQVARLVANELASGNAAGPTEISIIAENVENTFPVNPKKPPAIRSGGGRLLELKDLFGPGR